MTEKEWLAQLDAFVARELTAESVRVVLDALVRRVNSIVISYANREHDDVQALARRLDAIRALIEREVGH